MLRLSSLMRGLVAAPLRQARRPGILSASTRGLRTGDEDDDEEDEDLELDWDDDDDDDDDDDGDDWDATETWDLDGDDDATSAGKRKVEEHVKQKVRVRRAQHSKRRFVDRIRVKATGGHGGNGCASFFSESAMRKRPNGGHGGGGGDVYIEADARMQNLANATHHFRGGAGLNGMRTFLPLGFFDSCRRCFLDAEA
ncbi:hypothetical protein BBJ28_00010642 [Nothophytophthora sp. Chile5]|nr:hypothetical protein BBJ28_00010642 [Nothophytophthora sp. Chile5]